MHVSAGSYASSPKRDPISTSSAAIASSASAPSAVTRMRAPGLANRDAVLLDANLRLEASDQLDELGRGARMQPTLVDDLELANQRRAHGKAIFH